MERKTSGLPRLEFLGCTAMENQGPMVDGMVWHGQIIKSFSVARPQATATHFSEVFGKIRFMNYAGCKPGT